MIPYERRKTILDHVGQVDVAYIDDLVELIGASSSTVRRDVNALAADGRLVVLRGGAVKLNDHVVELPVATKRHLHNQAKRAIARAAADMVGEGDIVYLDSGTTTQHMLPFLCRRNVTIVTSNARAIATIETSRATIVILGGDLLPSIGSIAGPLTERALGQMFFHQAFLGASGCSLEAGINTFDMREAAKKRLAHSNARRTVVLADHSKFGVTTFCKAVELSECAVVTDEPHELLSHFRDHVVVSGDAVRAETSEAIPEE